MLASDLMLLVRTRLAPSPIHGLGLFSVDPIPRGAAVWRFTPGFDLDVPLELVNQQPEHFRDVLLHYGYVDAHLNRFILCCDDARFINHSDTPNIGTERADDAHGIDVAMRDIAAGEELTIDYRLVEGSAPAPHSMPNSRNRS